MLPGHMVQFINDLFFDFHNDSRVQCVYTHPIIPGTLSDYLSFRILEDLTAVDSLGISGKNVP
jgi:hypothetical protein